MQRCKKEYYSNLLSWKLKIPEIKISARLKIISQNLEFKILAFQNPEFKILVHLKILAFQNPEFKILVFQNHEFKIFAHFKVLPLQNPEFKTLADFKI